MKRDSKAAAIKAAATRIGLSVEEYLAVPNGQKRCSACKVIKDVGPDTFPRASKSPDGYKAKCHECASVIKRTHYQNNQASIRARQSAYRKANLEKMRESNAKWRAQFWPTLRAEAISAYGGCCSCCGESEPLFLDIDHIHNDGYEWRRLHGNSRRELLALKRAGWPKEHHQLLCSNCNQGKARNGGICPHKKNRNADPS
jgi:hypothetical protein